MVFFLKERLTHFTDAQLFGGYIFVVRLARGDSRMDGKPVGHLVGQCGPGRYLTSMRREETTPMLVGHPRFVCNILVDNRADQCFYLHPSIHE